MAVKYRNCPICQSLDSRTMMSTSLVNFDSIELPLSIQIAECLGCGFIFNNKVDTKSLNKFYDKDSFYFSESSFGTGGNDANRYETYLTCLSSYLNYNSIIVDIGCGKGQLVKYLNDKGFANTSGIEFDKRMVKIAIQQGIPVHEGTSSNLPMDANSVDMLIYTHVLEHLYELDKDIEQARKCLKNNGLMFIEVPDATHYSEARVFDYFWVSLAEHINHFSALYLERLMTKHGFKKILTTETIAPYNNPVYGYPSLRMLFQKGTTEVDAYENMYSSVLRNKVNSYIINEGKYISKDEYAINELKNSRVVLFVWGIGMEFFTLSTFTNLLKCDNLILIDKSLDKQRMTVHGKSISDPSILKQAISGSMVLLSSVFNEEEMKEYLNKILFKGRIVILGQRGGQYD